jgi:hypothetical protein
MHIDTNEIEIIIEEFFDNSDESNFFFELLTLRGNVEATFQRFRQGISSEVIKLIEELNDEIEKRFFKYTNAYTEFSPHINELNGLSSMMQSSNVEISKLAISTIQILAKIYLLKKILIEYFRNIKIAKLNVEVKK